MKLLIFASLTFFATAAHGAELPIFDAHIHYSHDAVQLVVPALPSLPSWAA